MSYKKPKLKKLVPKSVKPTEEDSKEETFAKMDYCLRVAGTYYNVGTKQTLNSEQVKQLQSYGKFLYWYLENFDRLHYDRPFMKEEAKREAIIKDLLNHKTDEQSSTDQPNESNDTE